VICTCIIKNLCGQPVVIDLCPLHAAAPEMLEVLIRVSKEMTCFDCRETAKLVDAIIVKAEGKSTTIDSRKV
jgi:hypothetical protein